MIQLPVLIFVLFLTAIWPANSAIDDPYFDSGGVSGGTGNSGSGQRGWLGGVLTNRGVAI